MTEQHPVLNSAAPVARRAAAIETALQAHGLPAADAIEEGMHNADEVWLPERGARVVARAWVDAEFQARLLVNGKSAVANMGIELPKHHRHLVVLENTPTLHNVICCTLCSCTAFTVIGLPPDWYKDLEYRSRIVRESRTVLREMGLDLPAEMELRVWDTTADTRYMVLPVRPAHTAGWTEAQLAEIVTKDAMIGVARL
jgi:nitrile hydratase subunit alpha